MSKRVYSFRPDGRPAAPEDGRLRQLETEAKTAADRTRRLEREVVARRGQRVVDQAIRERRLEESDRDEWLRRYERDPELVTKILQDLHPAAHRVIFDASDARDGDVDAVSRLLGISRDEVI